MFCFLVFLQGGKPCGGGSRESSLWTARDDDLSPLGRRLMGPNGEFLFCRPSGLCIEKRQPFRESKFKQAIPSGKTVSEMGKISVDQSWPDCARVTDKLSNPFFPGFCRLYNAKQDPVPCK